MAWVRSVRTVQQDSTVAKVSYGQFGTNAELSWCGSALGPGVCQPAELHAEVVCLPEHSQPLQYKPPDSLALGIELTTIKSQIIHSNH